MVAPDNLPVPLQARLQTRDDAVTEESKLEPVGSASRPARESE